MKRFKQILKKLCCLPPLPTVLIALPSFVFVFVNLGAENKSPLAYVSFGLSAYAVIITSTGIAGMIKAAKNGWDEMPLMKKIRSYPVGNKLLGDVVFRSEVTLHGGLVMNLLYAALNLYSGVRYRSAWFVALAFYYILLSVMRGLLVGQVHKTPVGENIPAELRSYRTCGIVLLLMNQALAGIVIYIVNQNRGFTYSGVLIYAMAAYTFYITIAAVINVVRFRKRGSPLLSAAKAISLTAALVSMLSLETAMLAQFGGNQPEFRRFMTGASGGAVCVFVLVMAVYMIVHASRRLKAESQSFKI